MKFEVSLTPSVLRGRRVRAGFTRGFLPIIIRAFLGEPVFGSNWHQQLFVGVSLYCTCFLEFLIVLYAVAPCVWCIGQLRLARALLSLIAPDRSPGLAWDTHRASLARAERPPLPRLDLRLAPNAVAWGALWRILHGRAFCPCVELKLQMYCAICTGVFFISSAVNSAASFVTANIDSGNASGGNSTAGGGGISYNKGLGLDFKLASILKLVLLAFPLVLQVPLFLAAAMTLQTQSDFAVGWRH